MGTRLPLPTSIGAIVLLTLWPTALLILVSTFKITSFPLTLLFYFRLYLLLHLSQHLIADRKLSARISLVMKHKQKNVRALRRKSKALRLLSALASGTVNLSADIASDLGRYPSISKLTWNRTRNDRHTIEIDLEQILHDARERASYQRAVKTLQRRRYAKLTKKKGTWVLIVTEAGKRRLQEVAFDKMHIAKTKHWDGKWRIVLFDIPETNRYARGIFRDRLKSLGFYQFQKSAFVLPFPCADELDAIIQYFNITEHVTFFSTNSLGYQEAKALHHFKLKR